MPFFGSFTQGLAGGLQAGQQMKMQAEEHKLKARMLDFQAKKMEADQQAQEQQQRGMADYVQAATQGVPDQFGGPVQGPIEASGKLPAQPAPQRQATPQELYGLSLNAVRPQDAYHLIQQQQKPGSNPQDVAEMLKQLGQSGLDMSNMQPTVGFGPTGARVTVRPKPRQGYLSEIFHSKFQGRPENLDAAIQAVVDAGGSVAEARSFMTQQGALNAQTGAPMGTPASPSAPPIRTAPGFQPGGNVFYDPSTMTPAEAQQGARQIPLGPTPPAAVQGVQPSPLVTGQSRFNQQAATKAGAVKQAQEDVTQNNPAPLGKEKDMARVNEKGQIEFAPAGKTPRDLAAQGFRTVDQTVLDSARALAPANTAFAEFKRQAMQLAKESEGLLGSASNAAGAVNGIIGGLAQRAGASNTGDNLRSATLNFMSHYDKVVGGIRGASSPQLLQVMENRAPKPGMAPQQIWNRTQYLEDIFNTMQAEIKNTINGKPFDTEALSRVIMKDPDKSGAKPAPAQGAEARTQLNGKTYIKRNGQWFEE